jgi:tryptophan synthase alpha chain
LTSIKQAFEEKNAFIPFTVGGYPDKETSKQLVKSMVENGADIVELGIPFSDPMADGPTIMKADKKALEQDIKPEDVLDIASEFQETPVVILAYSNTIRSYGYKDFFNDAEKAGVNGLIMPDMPPEMHQKEIEGIKTSVKPIFLIAQNTPQERIEKIEELTEGFAYLVSVKGTTGTRKSFSKQAKNLLQKTEDVNVPRCVGFGISDSEQAREALDAGADGVIMGSALIKCFNQKGLEGVQKRVENISEKLHGENTN